MTRARSSSIRPTVGCATKRGTGLALIVLARPWQWVKNGLVLAALVFSHRLFYPRDTVLAAVALVAFCALSSFAYVLNDISDREADRLNPEKRDRPLACGDLTIAQSVCFAIVLGAIATLLSIAIGINFLGIAALYVLFSSNIHCRPANREAERACDGRRHSVYFDIGLQISSVPIRFRPTNDSRPNRAMRLRSLPDSMRITSWHNAVTAIQVNSQVQSGLLE